MPLPTPFDAADWYRGLDVAERAALLAEASAATAGAAPGRRFERWRTQKPFTDADVFAARLAGDGLDADRFSAVLATSPEDLAAVAPPPVWLRDLAAAFAVAADPQPPLPPGEDEATNWGFHGLFAPLVSRAAAAVRRGAEELAQADAGVPIAAERVVPLLARSLAFRLYEMMEKTLVLELNVARMGGDLDGETPEARYACFVRRLVQPRHALPILAEYPVLARQGVETVERWRRFSLELLGHLAADRHDLERNFGELGELEEVQGGAGDSHRGGRTVHVLTFSSGLRLVYKPRPLSVERHFQHLLAWLNERGEHPPFRVLRVLDRGSHGWSEHVAAGPCRSRDEVERFYLRQGGYLALLYALEANDFHFQNVLAAGEHPVLVDLESLFQQRVMTFDPETASGQAAALIAYSVIRTGLLPQFAWRDDSARPLELSGLGGAQGQVDAGARTMADRHGTDEMRMVHREVAFGGGQNRPSLDGVAVNALAWAGAIEAGFESVYRTILAHRDELLAAGGPLDAFADDPVRVILRHTQFYRLFLLDCFHPDLQRDALDRDRHLDRLWIGAETRPEIGRIAPLEAAELRALDVPLFSTRPASRDLVSGEGRRLVDFFDDCGLDLVRARLGTLGERDLDRQRWMIGASLRALDTSWSDRGGRQTAREASEPASRRRLLAAAERVGDRLAELALVGSAGEASWVGIAATDEQHFMPAPLGPDLYGGAPGIALFLAYLGALSGEPRHTELAEAAWRTVIEQLDDVTVEGAEMGAFLGSAGLVYTALHLDRLCRRPDVLAPLGRLLGHLEGAIETDAVYDLLGGSAGCIPVLLAAHQTTGDDAALVLAVRCGERLLSAAREVGPGLAWVSARTGERPLAGLSHGAAGISWALFALAAACGDERFGDAARRALDYERTLFDREQRNWRDLRTFLGPEGGFSVAWCNGAAGIGLARLASLELVDGDPCRHAIAGDLEHALATTLANGFAFNHSLCHGALGNLELVAEVGRRRGDHEQLRRVGLTAAAVCDEVEQGRYHCGVPGGFETPGLLDGLAGIGYGLLRLAEPERVPSVLLLAGPPAQ